jgi:hypothetical protein
MTLLEIVNKVLRRLREDEVSSLSTEYSMLIADFVADAHREVQEFHDWSKNDYTIAARLTAGTHEYDLTRRVANGGSVEDSYRPPGSNSFLRFTGPHAHAWLVDNLSDTTGVPLRYVAWDDLYALYQEDTNAEGEPEYFSIQPSDLASVAGQVEDGWRMLVYPAPTATKNLRLRFHAPEALIDPDTDSPSRQILTPWRPIVLGAIFLALNERGEEMGEPGALAEKRYYAAMVAEKERDLNLGVHGNTLEFYRD